MGPVGGGGGQIDTLSRASGPGHIQKEACRTGQEQNTHTDLQDRLGPEHTHTHTDLQDRPGPEHTHRPAGQARTRTHTHRPAGQARTRTHTQTCRTGQDQNTHTDLQDIPGPEHTHRPAGQARGRSHTHRDLQDRPGPELVGVTRTEDMVSATCPGRRHQATPV
ncbi:hypothetical protein RRG08_030023 [Elysia crispata]|uniref:Uncharacterized protein n=1 Tax=Elysia crispata TaxID=231223 RepID=A0AAE1CPJ6_9GAST|nr:hypothetical protein RRG08_030023 [Elysia crispata]